jgi:hypothetical protein
MGRIIPEIVEFVGILFQVEQFTQVITVVINDFISSGPKHSGITFGAL